MIVQEVYTIKQSAKRHNQTINRDYTLAKIINIKNEVLIRVYIVGSIVVLFALLIIGQAIRIQVFDGDKWQERRDALVIKEIPIQAERGNIFAADGSILATALPFFDIRFDPTIVEEDIFEENVDSLARALASINIEKTEGGWKDYLERGRKGEMQGYRHLKIKNSVDFAELERIKKFPIFNQGNRYASGLIAEERFKREKPFNSLAHRTIGRVDTGRNINIGLEGYFNNDLRGESGKRLMYRLAGGDWIPVGDLTEIEPQKGKDIVTTIDVNLQDITHHALYDALERQNAAHGTAIVMEVKTGAIRAIANLQQNDRGGYGELFNFGIGWRYEPGSTYKLASIMALLEDGYIELDNLIEIDSGKYQFYEEVLVDSGKESFVSDTISIRRAFEISSNVGMAKLINHFYGKNKRSAERFIQRLQSFYLHLPTGVEIKGEQKPYIKQAYNKEDLWSGTTLPWMAIGYESLMTPLQLLTLYNTVANNGLMMKPHLVSEIQLFGEQVKKFPPTVVTKRIASKETIAAAKELLEGVVLRGTAAHLQSNQYRFAGKTGTAQANYHKIRATEIHHVASFVGYFPAKNPVYSCIVVVNDPKGSIYGGDVAGPVFRKIADRCFETKTAFYDSMQRQQSISNNNFSLLRTKELPDKNIGYRKDFESIISHLGLQHRPPTSEEWTAIVAEADSLNLQRRTVPDKQVPNVVGMGLRDAIYILENRGLEVSVQGAGKVVRQSIIPGTRIRGQQIKIFLG